MKKFFSDFISDFKNRSEKRKVLSLGGMISVIVALAFYLVLEFGVDDGSLPIRAEWLFFIALFFTTGLFYAIYGLIRRLNAVILVGLGCAVIGAMFLLIGLSLDWSIVISVTAGLVIILYVVTFMIKPPTKTTGEDVTDEPSEERVDQD